MSPLLRALLGLVPSLLTSNDLLDTVSGTRRLREQHAHTQAMTTIALQGLAQLATPLAQESLLTWRTLAEAETQRHAITTQGQLVRKRLQHIFDEAHQHNTNYHALAMRALDENNLEALRLLQQHDLRRWQQHAASPQPLAFNAPRLSPPDDER